ncbi:hypothetical protein SprV_0100210700 [Sparganum proliferum]
MTKRSENRRSHLRSRRRSQKVGSQVTSAPTPPCQQSATSDMLALLLRTPHANRPSRTLPDAMCQQSDNVNSSSHSRPCRKSRYDDHPVTADHTVASSHYQSPASPALPQPLSPPKRPAPPTPRTLPTGGTTPDVPPPATITVSIPASNDVDSVHACTHCDRIFISRLGLADHLRVHRTETGEPVRGAATYTRRVRLNCPRTFSHPMGLLDRMHIHENLRQTTAGYTTPSYFSPPALALHHNITNRNAKHSTVIPHLSGKCVSWLILHVVTPPHA